MNVAIIGAGVSGLSCAYELNRSGIVPTVFEEKDCIGHMVDFNTCTLKLFDRSYSDPVKHLKRLCGLELKPASEVKNIIMYSPNKRISVSGKLGYTFLRGENTESLENQLAKAAGVSILFKKHIEYEDIKNDYDFVVDATGKSKSAENINSWTPQLNAFVRIATISGSFDPYALSMWVDNRIARQCFAFQLASCGNKACLAVIVDGINHNELDYYWEEFCKLKNIKNAIIKTSDVEHKIGIVKPARKGNLLITGKAAGMIDTILGFGMISAVESGVFAARSIIHNKNYDKMLKPIRKDLKMKYDFRIVISRFKNDDYDRILGILGTKAVEQLIYRNPLAKINQFDFLAKLYIALSKKV
jgi:digeranylgeranylglycerophospholipid reductase